VVEAPVPRHPLSGRLQSDGEARAPGVKVGRCQVDSQGDQAWRTCRLAPLGILKPSALTRRPTDAAVVPGGVPAPPTGGRRARHAARHQLRLDWSIGYYFTHDGGTVHAHVTRGSHSKGPGHYFSAQSRDFVAFYLR